MVFFRPVTGFAMSRALRPETEFYMNLLFPWHTSIAPNPLDVKYYKAAAMGTYAVF